MPKGIETRISGSVVTRARNQHWSKNSRQGQPVPQELAQRRRGRWRTCSRSPGRAPRAGRRASSRRLGGATPGRLRADRAAPAPHRLAPDTHAPPPVPSRRVVLTSVSAVPTASGPLRAKPGARREAGARTTVRVQGNGRTLHILRPGRAVGRPRHLGLGQFRSKPGDTEGAAPGRSTAATHLGDRQRAGTDLRRGCESGDRAGRTAALPLTSWGTPVRADPGGRISAARHASSDPLPARAPGLFPDQAFRVT